MSSEADRELLFKAVIATVHELIWADGSIDPTELVVAAVVAREILGEDTDFKQITPFLKRPEAPPAVDRASLSVEQRRLLLRAAVEIAKADGSVEPEELEALADLGLSLGLDDANDRIAEAIADPENVATRWKGR